MSNKVTIIEGGITSYYKDRLPLCLRQDETDITVTKSGQIPPFLTRSGVDITISGPHLPMPDEEKTYLYAGSTLTITPRPKTG